MTLRAKLEAALAKPIIQDDVTFEEFDPWEDVIDGIHGCYASQADVVFIAALEALRDHTTYDFIKANGFAGEFALYVLSGHGYTDYGTSPRAGWWSSDLDGLLQPLIDKWKAYYCHQWDGAQ
ncbi:hypothetical protein ACLBV5_09790 [Brevundimonas sp. M1A4_2e]